jgi:hypothetical protein
MLCNVFMYPLRLISEFEMVEFQNPDHGGPGLVCNGDLKWKWDKCNMCDDLPAMCFFFVLNDMISHDVFGCFCFIFVLFRFFCLLFSSGVGICVLYL